MSGVALVESREQLTSKAAQQNPYTDSARILTFTTPADTILE
jgi:hypothetical protein